MSADEGRRGMRGFYFGEIVEVFEGIDKAGGIFGEG
jgi:hypothetical protein